MKNKRAQFLAFFLLAAAVWLSVLLLRRGERDPEDPGAGQRRAFAAAVQAVTEEGAAKLKTEAASSNQRTDALKGYREAARVNAARRDFLAKSQHWSDPLAKQIAVLESDFHKSRKSWAESLIRGPIDRSAGTTAGAKLMRENLDFACEDLTKLTPEAQKAWKKWEGLRWADYPVWQHVQAYDSPESPGASLGDWAKAHFMATGVWSLRPLQDEVAYLSDLERKYARDRAEHSVNGKHGEVASGIHLEWLRAREGARAAESRLAAKATEAGDLLKAWKARDWEGYHSAAAQTGPGSGTLPVPPHIKEPEPAK